MAKLKRINNLTNKNSRFETLNNFRRYFNFYEFRSKKPKNFQVQKPRKNVRVLSRLFKKFLPWITSVPICHICRGPLSRKFCYTVLHRGISREGLAVRGPLTGDDPAGLLLHYLTSLPRVAAFLSWISPMRPTNTAKLRAFMNKNTNRCDLSPLSEREGSKLTYRQKSTAVRVISRAGDSEARPLKRLFYSKSHPKDDR